MENSIAERGQGKEQTNKVLRSKSLHVGLIWLLSNLDSVAGADVDETRNEEGDGWQWIWLLCGLIRTLRLVEWLRRRLLMRGMGLHEAHLCHSDPEDQGLHDHWRWQE